MKVIYTIGLCCLPLCGVLSVQATPEAEYGKLSKTYTLHEDGSQEYRFSMELTLFTHTAMRDEYGESFIVYHPDYQELKIHTSYTRQKDGTIIKTPANAFVEVLPRQAAGAPAYNRLKEMVVVHTGLELGATIYLDYSVYTQPGYLPDLDIFEPVAQGSPVKDYTLTLSVPENKPLHYTLYKLSVRPKETQIGGQKQVTWKITSLPAASREPQVSALAGDIALLAASGYASPEEALQVLGKQLTAKGDQPVLSLAETLTEGKSTETDKLQAILNHVVHHVGSSRLTLRETGYRLRPSDDVIASAYGTEAEKVNLLAALLNAAGIRAEVAASFPRNVDSNCCGLSAISDLFVWATADGKTFWLAPNSESMSEAGKFAAYKRYYSLTHQGKELTAFAAPPTTATAIDYRYTIAVTPEQADITASGSISDALLPYINKKSKKETTTVQSLTSNSGYVILSLPDVPQGVSHTSYARYNSRRKSNLLLPALVNETYHYAVSLSDSIRLASPAGEKSVDNSCGMMTCSIKQNGNTIEVIRSIALKKQLITPSDYADFRRLMTEWADTNNRRLLLKTVHTQ
ncbi:MAG: DUF3857 domain-containing protein [Bacteroidales bacterium]